MRILEASSRVMIVEKEDERQEEQELVCSRERSFETKAGARSRNPGHRGVISWNWVNIEPLAFWF